ncbi:hypothetical protein [Streptomyces erythrochromogenes]|uniref:hypothetical protein n=1 Tax=Streptomyces erythrochromogenes TaxID=285574 RepID=UPI0002F0E6EA
MTLNDPLSLVRQITQEIDRLTTHLDSAPPAEAAQLLAHVLAPEGVLDKVTALMASGSRFAQDRATAGALPAEVWLALGRASNDLDAVSGDLAEHTEDLHRIARPAAVIGIPPVASPLVARRHR